MREVENHPIEIGFIQNGIKTLIVGTFPPKEVYESDDHFFFYSSTRNHFWNRMENIFPEWNKLKKTKTKCAEISPEQNKIDKENFSKEKKIGFLDIFSKISRMKNSTKDNDLICVENIVENGKLDKVIIENESLRRVCCTYKLAFEILKCKIEQNKLSIIEDSISANGQKLIYKIGKREIEIYLLYPATRSRDKNETKDTQYKKLLFS
ncbi:uracil-DNA glycosylase family protein [Flavobacterium commune]|uniref:DNA glycosylase n=1 Tax=Flavobacterium commune TaxID=1306519 RepID=A0A1D9P7X8_9FLAO|nr:hypothetical protein [Flavobacterium commune]AOZ98215.1 hypothetical protein BIW12_01475 [Flavobacterium commune]